MKDFAQTILKIFLSILTGISILVTSILSYFLYERSTMDFNSEGNYFDGLVVYHQQSVTAYGILFLTSLIISVFLLFLVRKQHQ